MKNEWLRTYSISVAQEGENIRKANMIQSHHRHAIEIPFQFTHAG